MSAVIQNDSSRDIRKGLRVSGGQSECAHRSPAATVLAAEMAPECNQRDGAERHSRFRAST